MNRIFKGLAFIFFAVTISTGCKKQTDGPLMDIRPVVPVIIQNAVDYRPDPTVTTSKAGGGAIKIILTLGGNSGRTIKEITKIAASTSYTAIQSTGTTGFYIAAPIAVNATSYTFNTTVAEYVSKGPGVIPGFTNSELAKRFYFMLTLDDGSVVVTQPVRVLYLD